MDRQLCRMRPDWQRRVEERGCAFHTSNGIQYWVEGAYYQFTLDEIDRIEAVASELHEMCLEVVSDTVQRGDYQSFCLPENAIGLIEASWRQSHKGIYGRFDLCIGASDDPKLYEYNADTPTALLEAAVLQWDWLEDVGLKLVPGADQFNSIHERLIARWREVEVLSPVLHVTGLASSREDWSTALYVAETAMQAGLCSKAVPIDDIGWQDGVQFVDQDDQPIRTLFKLYPWEWLLAESFGPYITSDAPRMIEPAWKLLLASKGVLVELWRRFPTHPALLPASFVRAEIDGPAVRKPVWGREGSNILLERAGRAPIRTDGPFAEGPFVWQRAHSPRLVGGAYPVIGAWMVGDTACGVGIRESDGLVTDDRARFVPHLFA
ncbi:MAG: glutathionylspermidine synthase family protein [Alphaproteobacteria bacterium]|nr:glutathionylspermidine synthase family protein [Alphaproteobacteria bacterium]TAD91861.1 MAG: glutathionylspermidine synthase family protein [Alphaproteobacteria bacterium]